MTISRAFNAAALALFAVLSLSATTLRAQECDTIAQMIVDTPTPPQTPSSLKIGLEKLKAAPKDPDVLLLGDSLAANWKGDDLKRDLGDRSVWNLGVNEYTIQNTLWTLAKVDKKKISPRIVILVVGTNNFSASSMPVCSVAYGIEKVVSMIGSNWPKAKIFLLSVPPRGPDFQMRADERIELNKSLAEFAHDKKQLAFVSFDEERLTCGAMSKPKLDPTQVACQPDIKYQCTYFRSDNTHFNSDGYVLVRQAIAKTSETVFGSDLLQ